MNMTIVRLIRNCFIGAIAFSVTLLRSFIGVTVVIAIVEIPFLVHKVHEQLRSNEEEMALKGANTVVNAFEHLGQSADATDGAM